MSLLILPILFLCLLRGKTKVKPIYCKFSNDRDKKFQIRTTIELNDEGQREVVKQAVSQESVTHIQEMYHNYKRMCESYKDTVFRANMCNLVGDSVHFEFLEGRTFENILDDLYKKRRFIEIIDKIKEFRDVLYSLKDNIPFVYTDKFDEIFGRNLLFQDCQSLKVSNIDMVFNNIIVQKEWTVIDYEWVFDFPVPIEFILYRVIYYYVHGSTKRDSLTTMKIFQLMGIADEKLSVYAEMERNFQNYIRGEKATLPVLKNTMLKRRKCVLDGKEMEGTDYVQVYFDYGDGLCEEHSVKKYYNYSDGSVELNLKIMKDVVGVRVDPATGSILLFNLCCKINGEVKGVSKTNGTALSSRLILFSCDDPQINFDGAWKDAELEVSYGICAMSEENGKIILEDYLERLYSFQNKEICIKKLEENINSLNDNMAMNQIILRTKDEKIEFLNSEYNRLLKEKETIELNYNVLVEEKRSIELQYNALMEIKNAIELNYNTLVHYVNTLHGKLIWRMGSILKRTLKSIKKVGLINTLIKGCKKIKKKLTQKEQIKSDQEIEITEEILKTEEFTSSIDELQMARPSQNKEKILVVVHEAQKAGGSLLSLSIIKTLKRYTEYEPIILVIAGGPLADELRNLGKCYELNQQDVTQIYDENRLHNIIEEIAAEGVKYALCNCVVTGWVQKELSAYHIKMVTMVHELPTSIKAYNFVKAARRVQEHSDDIVFAADFVKRGFVENFPVEETRCHVIPQGVYTKHSVNSFVEKKYRKAKLCTLLGINTDCKIIMGCGFGNFRKGLDWFGQIAIMEMQHNENTHFLWLGNWDQEFFTWINNDLERNHLKHRFHWMEYVDDPGIFFGGSDVFLLSSREDPFPSVALESMKGYTPVIAFQDAGGIPEILTQDRGIIIPYGDCDKCVVAIETILNDEVKCHNIVTNAKKYVSLLTPRLYVEKLLEILIPTPICMKKLPPLKVSVIIPNYNYAQFIPERLDSILNQTERPFEIIFLDDVSNDNSVAIAKEILEASNIPYKIITNTQNQGCFRQWVKGINCAEGDIIWIAEADDLCEYDFIERVLPAFADDQVNLAYAQSEVIYEQGEHSGFIYTEYTKDLNEVKWNKDYKSDGETEIIDGLGIKNTIPNASGVLMRKSALKGIDDDLSKYTISGDWFTYVYAIKVGKIAFYSDILNYHRRHSSSIIHQKEQDIRLFIEMLQIKNFIANNFLIPESIYDSFVNHIKYEYIRLMNESVPLFEDQKELSDLQKSIEIRVRNNISKYTFLKNNPKKNIMFIIPDMEIGGGQTLVIRLANYFSKFHNVYLYNARPWLCEDRVYNMISDKVHILDSKGDPNQLREFVIAYHIDTINDHIWWSDKIAYKAVSDLDTKIVLSMHGCYEALMQHPDWDEEFDILAPDILNRANNIIYATDKNKRIFSRIPVEEKSHKIYYGYELESIPIAVKESLNMEQDSFVFGLVARGIKEKGFGEAVEAFKILKKQTKRNIDLVLVGNGPYIDGLKKENLNERNIHFLDSLKKPSEWIGWVKIFDCGLLPTYYISETLPNSVIEYLAYNVPVISTDIGDIKYMLESEEAKAGILLNLHHGIVEVKELAEAMLTMLIDQERYMEYKKGTKELFSQFDIKNFAERYYSLF